MLDVGFELGILIIVFEYMVHIDIIINKRMKIYPAGEEGENASSTNMETSINPIASNR